MNVNKSLFYFSFIILFLLAKSSFGARLSLPVELSIENGNFKNCMVKVTKNGSDVMSIPGKEKLNIKLDFNTDYLLSFSKPGYITKKIAVNTTVTPARESQLFEPYKIGVKLFKQYEGINIVVYNQPVAKIKFNPAIDDFDYDVDYTKSILSQLTVSEQQLETRAVEERRLITSGELPKEGFVTRASSSERFAQFPPIKETRGMSTLNKSQADSTFPIYPMIDPVDTAILNGGADTYNPVILNSGNDNLPSGNGGDGDDIKSNLVNEEGVNKAKGILNTDNGRDKSKALSVEDNYDNPKQKTNGHSTTYSSSSGIENNSGFDKGKDEQHSAETEISKTKELTVEPNRTITTIKISPDPSGGQSAVIYRKVLYNWGGLYYFKNLTYSISKDLFESGTGEK